MNKTDKEPFNYTTHTDKYNYTHNRKKVSEIDE